MITGEYNFQSYNIKGKLFRFEDLAAVNLN
jgi:hypothetical protein